MKIGKKKAALGMVLVLMLSILATPALKMSAASSSPWQVNGKYDLNKKRLITYCELVNADDYLKKKTRTFKITPSTKFTYVKKNFSKKPIKKSQIGKYIKKIKKSKSFQFKFKKGVVTEIYYYR